MGSPLGAKIRKRRSRQHELVQGCVLVSASSGAGAPGGWKTLLPSTISWFSIPPGCPVTTSKVRTLPLPQR